MTTVNERFATAMQHLQAGRLESADHGFRQILATHPEHADALHFLGIIAFQIGHLDAAIQHIQRAIAINGNAHAYYCNLGNILQACRRTADAIACYQRALELNPQSLGALINLGNTHHQSGELVQAVACYMKALNLNPNSAEVHFFLGDALKDQGKLAEAAESYRRSLAIWPEYVEAINNLGVALSMQGQLVKAIESYSRALQLKPDFIDSHINMGNALKDQGRLDAATSYYRRAVELNPNSVEAISNLGIALYEQGKLEEAITCYQRALSISPESPEVLSNLGNALRDRGNLDEAIVCYCTALKHKADFAEAHCNMGIALKDIGKLEDAVESFLRALQLKPDYPEANCGLGIVHLLKGEWSLGWPRYDWRLKTKSSSTRSFAKPIWNGLPLVGKTILLHAEQGLGDTIQFIRFASEVKQSGGRVVVQCPKALVGLLTGVSGIDQVLDESSELPEWDVHCPLMSLPRVLDTRVETIPASIPYLVPEVSLMANWKDRLMDIDGFKIGICWQGNPTFRDDRERSVPLRAFSTLAEIPGIRLISLQKGPGTEQLKQVGEPFSVMDLGADLDRESGPFMDTAAIMRNLDLVITVDTVTGHLAGALGVPVWVALSKVPHWPWLLGRTDTPWYPTMRLFRKGEGDWTAVFDEMAKELNRQRSR